MLSKNIHFSFCTPLIKTGVFSLVAIGSIFSSSLPSAAHAEDANSKQAAAASSSDSAAAIVNGKVISVADVEKEIRRKPALGMQLSMAQNDPAKIQQVRIAAVNGMVDRAILLEKARNNPTLKEEEIKQAVAGVISQYGDRPRLEEMLKQIGTTFPQFEQDISDDFRIRKYLDQQISKVPEASEQELKAMFDSNPQKYAEAEKVKARHILIQLKPGASEADDKAAKAKIEKLYTDVTNPKADFAALARDNSECPSKEKGGDLGYFQKGMMVPEFEKVAYELKPNEISKPFKTQFGYHIVKVDEHQQASAANFESAKSRITAELAWKKKGEIIQSKIAELKKDAKVEIKLKQL